MPFIDHKPLTTEDKCTSNEHAPPSHQVLPDGTHTWMCPECGHITVIEINNSHYWQTNVRT